MRWCRVQAVDGRYGSIVFSALFQLADQTLSGSRYGPPIARPRSRIPEAPEL
jgi:hypothetical protein